MIANGPADFAAAIARAHAASATIVAEAAPVDPIAITTHIPAPNAGSLMVAEATSLDIQRRERQTAENHDSFVGVTCCQLCKVPGPQSRDYTCGTWNLCVDCADLFDSPYWTKER